MATDDTVEAGTLRTRMGHWHFVAWAEEERSRGGLSLSRSRPFGDDVWTNLTVMKLELETRGAW